MRHCKITKKESNFFRNKFNSMNLQFKLHLISRGAFIWSISSSFRIQRNRKQMQIKGNRKLRRHLLRRLQRKIFIISSKLAYRLYRSILMSIQLKGRRNSIGINRVILFLSRYWSDQFKINILHPKKGRKFNRNNEKWRI